MRLAATIKIDAMPKKHDSAVLRRSAVDALRPSVRGEERMRLRIRRKLLTLPAAVAVLAIVIACVTSSCNSQSFQQSSGPSMPVPPPAPVQPPPPPMNVARLLNGNWMATYPGGPLRVVIGLDQMLRGRNYVATLVDGNKTLPPAQADWRGTLDQ